MSKPFPYQALTEPVFQHEEYAVWADATCYLPEIPVLPRLFRGGEFSYSVEPSIFTAPPENSWHGHQDDFARRAKPRLPGWWCGVLEQTIVVNPPYLDTWQGFRPDQAPGRPPPQPWPGVYQEEPLIIRIPDDWKPIDLNPFHKRQTRLGVHGGYTEPSLYVVPDPLSWQGQLPEFAKGHKPRPHGDRTAITEPTHFVNPTPLSWRGEQPDFARGHQPRESGLWAGIIEASMVEIPPLDSWFTQRPEQARGHTPRPEGQHLAITEPTLYVVASLDSWLGSRPDFAHGPAPRPQGERINIGPPDLQTTPLVCAWQGYQQPIVNRTKPRPVTSYAAPVEASLQFVADVCTWYVEPVLIQPRKSGAWLPGASVLATYAANTGPDQGPWFAESPGVFNPCKGDARVWRPATKASVFVPGGNRAFCKPVEWQ